ncbi:MAG: hypothetical protein Q7T87_00445 [Polaromonas sp.]|nr:hypothetical protein [Polaromonas sp.]
MLFTAHVDVTALAQHPDRQTGKGQKSYNYLPHRNHSNPSKVQKKAPG